MDLVREIKVDTRKQLNDVIYDMNSTFYKRYVFRGHADDKYRLLPVLLREIPANMPNHDIFLREIKLLIKFFRECNNQGLKVPDIKKFRATYMSDYFDLGYGMNDDYYWPNNSIFELEALAQHYGLKTRFLDWTQDIRVALYFSCGKATDKSVDYCSIWAINMGYIQKRQEEQASQAIRLVGGLETEPKCVVERKLMDEIYDERIPLKFCVPAYCDNPNLNAQKGILSAWQYNMLSGISEKDPEILNDRIKFNTEVSRQFQKFLGGPADTSELTSLFTKYFSDNHNEEKKYEQYLSTPQSAHIDYLFYKIIFPNSISCDLKKQLQIEGYNTARLFPGYKGVADYLEENNFANH